MTFQDLYLGQRVRILSWDELNSISHHDSAYGNGCHFYFPICALVGYSSSSQSIPISSISFDSLIQPLTTP